MKSFELFADEDEPKKVLIKRFGISDLQAEAILSLRLRQLAKLEEIKIRAEKDRLSLEKQKIEKILSSNPRLKTLVKNEIAADARQYGDARKSPIVSRSGAQAFLRDDMIPVEPVTVILSKKGWIRAAKGHDVNSEKLIYKAGDELLNSAKGRSNQLAVFLDSTGRSYSLAVP